MSWNSGDTDGGVSSGSCTSAVAGLTLVNANTDKDIQPLFDGTVINLDAIGTTSLNARADVVGYPQAKPVSLIPMTPTPGSSPVMRTIAVSIWYRTSAMNPMSSIRRPPSCL